jgi:alpha-glucoside transport system substrate-binding protein
MHHMHKRTAVVGSALATVALTMSGIGVAADNHLVAGVPEVPTGYAELDLSLGDDQPYAGSRVTMQTQWVGGEGDSFRDAVSAYSEASGIQIDIAEVPSGQHETLVNVSLNGGAAADIIQLAQPAAIIGYGGAGQILELSSILDVEKLASEQPALSAYSTADGGVWAIPYRVDTKSVVWYPIKAFEDRGYAVPQTWDELLALSDQIIADGEGAPWCLGIDAGPATGWIATDWLEDVMLRTAGVDAYNAWVTNDLKFNSPEVKNAMDIVGQIFFTDGYVLGGSTAILATSQVDPMDPMFTDDTMNPGCWMQRQATWYGPDFFPDAKAGDGTSQYVIGEDIGLFYLPPIDPAQGAPLLGAGDGLMVTADRPEVRAVAQFLATPAGAENWIKGVGMTSANSTTPAEWSAGNYKLETAANIVANATSLSFDASDLMPASVGAGSFWNEMVNWIADGGANTEARLQAIDDSWPAE